MMNQQKPIEARCNREVECDKCGAPSGYYVDRFQIDDVYPPPSYCCDACKTQYYLNYKGMAEIRQDVQSMVKNKADKKRDNPNSNNNKKRRQRRRR